MNYNRRFPLEISWAFSESYIINVSYQHLLRPFMLWAYKNAHAFISSICSYGSNVLDWKERKKLTETYIFYIYRLTEIQFQLRINIHYRFIA